MSRSPHGVLIGVLVGALIGVLASPTPGTATAATAATPDDPPPTTAFENVFLPEDENISACISAVPQPGCGSSARGGWHQTLVFVVIIAGLSIVGWQIFRSVRRNRPDPDDPDGRDGAAA